MPDVSIFLRQVDATVAKRMISIGNYGNANDLSDRLLYCIQRNISERVVSLKRLARVRNPEAVRPTSLETSA
jgi:hypothetical protein